MDVFTYLIPAALIAVTAVLALGIYALFRGGDVADRGAFVAFFAEQATGGGQDLRTGLLLGEGATGRHLHHGFTGSLQGSDVLHSLDGEAVLSMLPRVPTDSMNMFKDSVTRDGIRLQPARDGVE